MGKVLALRLGREVSRRVAETQRLKQIPSKSNDLGAITLGPAIKLILGFPKSISAPPRLCARIEMEGMLALKLGREVSRRAAEAQSLKQIPSKSNGHGAIVHAPAIKLILGISKNISSPRRLCARMESGAPAAPGFLIPWGWELFQGHLKGR